MGALKWLRFYYSKYSSPDKPEGGEILGLGQELVPVTAANSFTHTYDLRRAYIASSEGCANDDCDWLYIYNRVFGTPNDSMNIPLWLIDAESSQKYVDWRATYQSATETSVANEFYVTSSSDLVSALEPSAGDLFRSLATYKPAVGKFSEPFIWSYFSSVQLDATSDFSVNFEDVSSDDTLVLNLRATDLAGNDASLYACSGPPNQYLLYIYAYDATAGWDGGSTVEDLPDFSVQLIHNGTIIRDTPAVYNQGSMAAILALTYTSGSLELKIHDEDAGGDEQLTHWDAFHALLDYANINAVGTYYYLDGNPSKNAKVFLRAIRCVEH